MGKPRKGDQRFHEALMRTCDASARGREWNGTCLCVEEEGNWRPTSNENLCLRLLTPRPTSYISSLSGLDLPQPNPQKRPQKLSISFQWQTLAWVLVGTNHIRVQESNTVEVLSHREALKTPAPPSFWWHCCCVKLPVAGRCSELPIELVPGGFLFS